MIKQEISYLLKQALEQIPLENKDISTEVFKGKFGDYSTNLAFKLAEANNSKDTSEIAKKIVAEIKNNNLFEKVEIAAQGFINFYLSPEFLQKELQIITEKKESFSRLEINKGKSARVEYISANPTGPLHLGNARGGPLGDTLANVLAESGYQVLREYVHNDIGGQVERLGRSLFHYIKIEQNVQSELQEDDYKGEYVKELAKEASKKIALEKLANEEEAVRALSDFALNKLFDENLLVVEGLGIEIDKIFNESDFLISGETEKVIKKLQALGLTQEKEGAVWFAPNDDYLEDREAVLVKSDGKPTYFANDIAYHNLKFKDKPDLVIDIFGSNHHGHVPKLQAAISALGYDLAKFRVILYQYVRLKKGEAVVKMAKRTGDYVTAEEVLKEVGKDAFRFFLLQRSPETHMDFDLELAKKESDDNPVYYIQYAYARMSSLIAKENREKAVKVDLKLIKEDQELELIKKLIELPELVETISKNFAVHQLTNYALELADCFNRFYEACRVISEDKEMTDSRLNLVSAAKITLGNTLRLLGISAPERM
ncbi:MAG: arginine--tRNA ligase [bacterium]|nr:arginine--tRNA ligase [bacterium]